MVKIGRNEPCPCDSGKKYKKCCGNLRTEAAIGHDRALKAHSDETGNSGNYLFDTDQPYFWTGTLVCESDVEREGAKLHSKCLQISGQSELHGNTLGLSGIDKIAPFLQEIFSKMKSRFLFTKIEKTHLAATKFFDFFMDSGLNHAVSNMQYGFRAMRLSLAVQFIQLLDDDDRRDFWLVYRTSDQELFRNLLKRILDRLITVHEAGVYHDRTVEILRDGMEWAIKYPEPFLDQKLSEADSPNVVAFSLLISLLHGLHVKEGITVGTFVHDEQSQFGRSLDQVFQILRRFDFDRTIMSSMLDIKELPTFKCDLLMERSRDSIGLQLIDVALWLGKRFYDSGGAVHGNAGKLAEFIISEGSISNFAFRNMQEGVMQNMNAMEALPIDGVDHAKVRALMASAEKHRQDRMRMPPDGLYTRELQKWSTLTGGGRPAPIPRRYLCAGGRHDTRLTKCYCDIFSS